MVTKVIFVIGKELSLISCHLNRILGLISALEASELQLRSRGWLLRYDWLLLGFNGWLSGSNG